MPMPDQYVDRKTVNQSYRPKSNEMSEGLKRARAPFRFRNAITGVILASFAVGVWAYSISAVKQDDFSDIDEEAKALAASAKKEVSEEEKKLLSTLEDSVESTKGAVASGLAPLQPVPPSPVVDAKEKGKENVLAVTSSSATRPRGIVTALLAERYPRLFDPQSKTLVWGAPPVDNNGKMRDSTKEKR
ncbi:hypothetical protein K474DRAFT_1657360 [Panus rudis PR-1116 ss-1]|nr:hypothetical protein K474DRAFT_1657360 [Panus rudis PR-1116 ss-1]